MTYWKEFLYIMKLNELEFQMCITRSDRWQVKAEHDNTSFLKP